MGIYKQTLIDMPDEPGIHVKPAGAKGEPYVYIYTKYFRNKDGKPRNKSKAIGKYDPDTKKMYPNDNYFQMFQVQPTMPEVSVYDYGYSYLVHKVSRDIGLLDLLENIFGALSMDLIIMAAYMIREGNAMDGVSDWQVRNYFPGTRDLITSWASSRIFESITDKQQRTFFKDWVKHASGEGTVCYDVTSISSYSANMIQVERGYNRDGEDLSQYNLGMFCDEYSRIPLYYNRYNGSIQSRDVLR